MRKKKDAHEDRMMHDGLEFRISRNQASIESVRSSRRGSIQGAEVAGLPIARKVTRVTAINLTTVPLHPLNKILFPLPDWRSTTLIL